MKRYAAEKLQASKKGTKKKKKQGGAKTGSKPVCLDFEDDDCITSLDMRVGVMKPAKQVSETLYMESVCVFAESLEEKQNREVRGEVELSCTRTTTTYRFKKLIDCIG